MDADDATGSWPSLTDGDLASLLALRDHVRERGFRFARPWKASGGRHVLAVRGATLTLERGAGERWIGRVACGGFDFPLASAATRGDAASAAVTVMMAQPKTVRDAGETEDPDPDDAPCHSPRPF